ncbi:MAG: ABC transporter substrate-binding protein [Acidobacteria bacterium]|nr:ABC transporter substrate-binding protein [Acidobacteriota bacterium]
MRVVSLCPSLTELVFDLGCGDRVVGRTRYCVRPEGRVEAVPTLGGTKNPKVEAILELAPDLVLLNREENRAEDAAALEAAGLNCRSFLPKTVDDTAAMIREVGELLGVPKAGEAMAMELERRADRARELASEGPAIRWAYLIWRKPWMAAGGDTFVDALLTLPGGVNVFADHPDRYPAITADVLRAADPDRIWLSSEPFPFTEHHVDELTEATGLPETRFQLVDGQLLSWHGSRTLDGVEYAARLIREVREPGPTAARPGKD